MNTLTFSSPLISRLFSLLSAFGIAIAIAGSPRAAEAGATHRDCGPQAWREVKKLARDCLDLQEKGETCDFISFGSRAQNATFEIDGLAYRAEIVDSEFSDGGDMNNVLVEREDDCRLELLNVPAFGDLLEALAAVRSR